VLLAEHLELGLAGLLDLGGAQLDQRGRRRDLGGVGDLA
jgi:hypothetical protein